MHHEGYLKRKRPRFFREPTDEDIEANGWAEAYVHAGVRARIVGSRVLAATVALGTGTAITIMEVLTNGNIKPADVVTNFGVPAIINGLAQVKAENQLRRTESEIFALLPDIKNAEEK